MVQTRALQTDIGGLVHRYTPDVLVPELDIRLREQVDEIVSRVPSDAQPDFLDFVLDGKMTQVLRNALEGNPDVRAAADDALELLSNAADSE